MDFLTEDQLTGMTLKEIESYYNPEPSQHRLIDQTRELAHKWLKRFNPDHRSWHLPDVTYERVFEHSSDRSAMGVVSKTNVCYDQSKVALLRVRTGFLEGYYCVQGHKFNHWGGPDGAETYAHAAAIIKELQRQYTKEQKAKQTKERKEKVKRWLNRLRLLWS